MSQIVSDSAGSRTITCSHRHHTHRRYDFGELWSGGPEDKAATDGRSHQWSGGFRGRPTLAQQIWPSLQLLSEGRPVRGLEGFLAGLRAFWRFLDAYEKQGWTPISSLEEMPSALSLVWRAPTPNTWAVPHHGVYAAVRLIVRTAWMSHFGDTRPWTWHQHPGRGQIEGKDLPTDAEVKIAMVSLKEKARAIFARWKQSDALAAAGRNLLAVTRNGRGKMPPGFAPNEADAHATYRHLIAACGNPLPSLADLYDALGISVEDPDSRRSYPRWWPRYPAEHALSGQLITLTELQHGLYPNADDSCCLQVLLMARTGWNESTVNAIDLGDPNWARPHGETVSSKLWMISAWKERAGDFQWTISMEKTTTGPYHIISTMAERNAALRDWIRTDPTHCLQPELAVGSPWACAGYNTMYGKVVTLSSGSVCTWWREHVADFNKSAPTERQIPKTMSPGDWRDIYASHVFSDSRYSWILVKWALGHKHLAATRHYLRTRIWRRFSEKKITEMMTVLIDGIQVSQRVDLAIIRAKVEFGYEPTDADRKRLSDHRQSVHERDITYTGYVCTDPSHPPQEIDPGNPSDGSMPCRRGDRCGGCFKGMAVDGQLLARRVAELRWLSENVNAVIWSEAHYASDLESLEATLRQWDEVIVKTWIEHWTSEIRSCRHKVIRFGAQL